MNLTIPFVDESVVNVVLLKANCFLINKHRHRYLKLSENEKKIYIKILWKKEFNIELIRLPNCASHELWTHAKFLSEREKVLFLFKWAS